MTEIQRFKNIRINKELFCHPDVVSGQRLDDHTFIVNFDIFKWLDILLSIGSIYTKLGDFVKLGLHFMTTVCGSVVANPIIYRLVPSPSRFEIRQ